MPCTWAVLPTLVGRLPKNGGHHQAVCRLGPTPFLSLGARGGSPVHGVPRCPQVIGLQVTRATSLLLGYGSPSAGGEPTGLVSPQGPPMRDPTAPPSQAVNSSPPLPGGRAHRPFLPSRLALGTPRHPFPKLTWTVPRDGGPRAEPTSFARSVWGTQASPGAEPTGWAWLAVLPRRGPRDGQEKACRSNAMANHRGASRRDTSAGPFQITGLCPALPT